MLRCCALIVLITVTSACRGSQAAPGTADRPTPALYPVTYRVVGSDGVHAAISFTTADGQREQLPDAALPWTVAVRVAPGTALSVIVQSLDQSVVTCSIEVGGIPVSKASGGRTQPALCSSQTPDRGQ